MVADWHHKVKYRCQIDTDRIGCHPGPLAPALRARCALSVGCGQQLFGKQAAILAMPCRDGGRFWRPFHLDKIFTVYVLGLEARRAAPRYRKDITGLAIHLWAGRFHVRPNFFLPLKACVAFQREGSGRTSPGSPVFPCVADHS